MFIFQLSFNTIKYKILLHESIIEIKVKSRKIEKYNILNEYMYNDLIKRFDINIF